MANLFYMQKIAFGKWDGEGCAQFTNIEIWVFLEIHDDFCKCAYRVSWDIY